MSIKLLIFKLISELFNNILKTVVIKTKIIKNNIHEVTFDYNNDIIVVNINYNKNERSETQELIKYIYII